MIEADGDQHAESAADAVRDRWFADEGYTVIGYGNRDILTNPDGVLTDLLARIEGTELA